MGAFDDTFTPLQNDFLSEDEKKLVEWCRSGADAGVVPATFSAASLRALLAIIDRLENPAA